MQNKSNQDLESGGLLQTPSITTPNATVIVVASPAAEKPADTRTQTANNDGLESSDVLLCVADAANENQKKASKEEEFVGCSLNTTLNRHTPMAIFIGCFLTFLFLLGSYV